LEDTSLNLLKRFKDLPTIKTAQDPPVQLLYADSAISFPMPDTIRPFSAFPKLCIPMAQFTATDPAELRARFLLVTSGYAARSQVTMVFRHANGLMRPLTVRFRASDHCSRLADIFPDVFREETWKVIVHLIADSIHVSEDRVILKCLRDTEMVVLFPFQPIISLFQHGFDTEVSTFSGVGKLFYDVAPDRISYIPSGAITIEDRFLDSDTARRMFFSALPARMACKLLTLQDDLIEQISTTHFADCLRVIVSRLSTEFQFDGSDTIYTIGIKHVLSSVMCATISPFASRVGQKSFFHLRTWSTIYAWIQQEGSILGRFDEGRDLCRRLSAE
jgi:hypothetical protein